MDFRILGPLEVIGESGPVSLPAAKQRSLLAVLLLHAGEVVSRDRLAQALWGEDAPSGYRKALQVHVSQLRKSLPGGVVTTRAPGYRIELEDHELDLARFEDLMESARAARDAQRFGTATSALREALSLWRGPPLDGLSLGPVCDPELRRLEELRLAATEDLFDAELALGHHAEIVGDARALVSREPLRERSWRQLMLALYRSGRQGEALEAYRQARDVLVEQLGLEASPELRALEQAILQHDPKLAATPAAEPVDASPPAGAPLVGREPELAVMSRALEDATAGRGRLVLVVGEPGIGKSRLAEELAHRAAGTGAHVLWGRCWEAGGAPAYWPWVQALRAYVKEASPDALRDQLGAGAPEVAQVVPSIRDALPDLAEPAAPETESARFRLFDATVGFLARASAQRPIVLVLDDLHAADVPSLLLLRFLAREIGSTRLLLVAAFRDVDPIPGEPLAEMVAEVTREPATRRLDLRGLSEPEVARYVELTAAEIASPRLAARLEQETEGNPLFVGEILRLLAAEGETSAAGALTIPQTVRDVIARRLTHLSQGCNLSLLAAAVLGREFEVSALTRMADLDEDALLEAMDEATDARVVSDVPGSPGRVRFAHVLIRDTLYDGLGAARRAGMHGRVVEALEALYGDEPGPHLAELAHHAIMARDLERGVAYARRAGDRARGLLAFEEATRLYQSALDTLQGDDRLRCELLLSLADARGRGGDGTGSKATFLQAAHLARSANFPDLVASAAADYGGRFLWERPIADERLLPLLEDGLRAVGQEDSSVRVRLLSRLGAALRGEPSREERDRIRVEAIEAARRLGDPATLAYALIAGEASIGGPGTAEVRLAYAEETAALSRRTGDRERMFDAHENAFWVAWELGDPDRRAAEMATLQLVAEEIRQPAQLWMRGSVLALMALSEGRFDDAREAIEQAAAIGERAQGWSAAACRRRQLFVLARQLDDHAGLLELVEDGAWAFPTCLWRQAVLGYSLARLGMRSEAEAILQELDGRDLATWHRGEEWVLSMVLLGEVCVLLGDARRGARVYELLLPHGSCNVVIPVDAALGSVSRSLGALAALTGDQVAADGHLREAAEMNARMGARPWLALTREDHARVLLSRAGPGDREDARELLDAAIAAYEELGMHSAAERARATARSLPVR